MWRISAAVYFNLLCLYKLFITETRLERQINPHYLSRFTSVLSLGYYFTGIKIDFKILVHYDYSDHFHKIKDQI